MPPDATITACLADPEKPPTAHPTVCPVCAAIVREIASFQSGQCWLAQTTIGERIGRSQRTIRTHLRALERQNVLRTERRGLNFTNRYALQRAIHPNGKNCRSKPAKSADNIVPDFVQSDKIKQAPAIPPVHDASKIRTITPADRQIASALIAAGISQRRALHLAQTYERHILEAQLRWLPDRRPVNPGAVLVTAIIDNFDEPVIARKRRKRAEATAASSAERAAQQRTEQTAAEERARSLISAQHARTLLPVATVATIERDAYAEIDRAFLHVIPRTSIAFTAAVRTAIDRKLAAALPNAETPTDSDANSLTQPMNSVGSAP